MLERDAYSQIAQWKRLKTKQGLLITGARQVGKTTLVRKFAHDNYRQLAEVSFLGNNRAIKAVSAAQDARDLLLRISTLARTELVPGETLVFLDEIQACEDVLTWVKFLEEASDLDFILSGSLLGIDLFNVRSVPVGFLQTLRMHPLTFFEFCKGNGIPEASLGMIEECYADLKPVPDYLHDQLMNLFYQYLLVGGMPDAVQSFVDVPDAERVRNIQSAIIETYKMDITKYVESPVERRHIKSIYEAIPNQLNKENKRFKFTKMDENARFSHLATAFDWLENAGITLPAMRVQEPTYPLGLAADTGSFKLFMSDVGLLTSLLMPSSDIDILNRKSAMNYGAMFENAVAQELAAQGVELYYYNKKGVGEVDFVMQDHMGDVSLVEVKSGKDYKRHRAMNNLLDTRNYRFKNAYVMHDGNVSVEGATTYLPIYMAAFLGETR